MKKMWYQRSLLKYADDMALVAWMSDEQSLVTYRQFVDPMVLQFLETLLQVNISKTEELCWGGLVVDQVETLSFLDTEIDKHWSFTQQANNVYKKAQQRLSLLRKLKGFDVR